MHEVTRLAAVWVLVVAVLVGATGCETIAPTLPDVPGTIPGPGTTSLLAKLTDAGFRIEPDRYTPVPAKYLHASVAAYVVNGESLAIWEYSNPDAAADDGRRVSPQGIDGGFHELGTEAKWFRHGRLLVLYVGTDPGL